MNPVGFLYLFYELDHIAWKQKTALSDFVSARALVVEPPKLEFKV
jgi:hypothetical protein